MPGPAPTPTALKIMKGNPGKRPLNKLEPMPEVGAPQPPDFIQGSALDGWNRITETLAPTRVLTLADWLVMAMTADAYGRWVDAREQVASTGGPVVNNKGTVQQNPYVWERNKAFEQLEKLLPKIGLTPADRSRLQAAPQENTDDDFFQLR